jgi:hypothetical protein
VPRDGDGGDPLRGHALPDLLPSAEAAVTAFYFLSPAGLSVAVPARDAEEAQRVLDLAGETELVRDEPRDKFLGPQDPRWSLEAPCLSPKPRS